MKKIMRRVVPLLTFELPLQYEQIEQLFIRVQYQEHQRQTVQKLFCNIMKIKLC